MSLFLCCSPAGSKSLLKDTAGVSLAKQSQKVNLLYCALDSRRASNTAPPACLCGERRLGGKRGWSRQKKGCQPGPQIYKNRLWTKELHDSASPWGFLKWMLPDSHPHALRTSEESPGERETKKSWESSNVCLGPCAHLAGRAITPAGDSITLLPSCTLVSSPHSLSHEAPWGWGRWPAESERGADSRKESNRREHHRRHPN